MPNIADGFHFYRSLTGCVVGINGTTQLFWDVLPDGRLAFQPANSNVGTDWPHLASVTALATRELSDLPVCQVV